MDKANPVSWPYSLDKIFPFSMFSYIQLINNFSQTVSMKNAYVGNSATQQKKRKYLVQTSLKKIFRGFSC